MEQLLSAAHAALLLLAGIGAGLSGSVLGLASLVSYPALLALGIPPVTANVTNSVALVFNSIGSVSGSLPELKGQRGRLRKLAPLGALGGAVGAGLLLLTPSTAFEKIVPWLIGLAGCGVLIRRPTATDGTGATAGAATPARRDPPWLGAALFVVCIYGGYFGAAAGVLILSLLLLATGESLPRANGLKNAVLGLANGVAALIYVLDGSVRWSAVIPLAVGCYLGGRVGPVLVRRSPPNGLRLVIFLAAVGLAVHLGIDAYG